MSSALDEFRAQREAVEQIGNRLAAVAAMLKEVRRQADALVEEPNFRGCLTDGCALVDHTQAMLRELRALREDERRRFWPAVWRRWVVALLFALFASGAFGAGYELARRPDTMELNTLRSRVELLDYVAQRVLRMTPAERREFDELMKFKDLQKR